MSSKRRHEGYLLIDNSFAARNAPDPFPSEADLLLAHAHGYTFAGMQSRSAFESATVTCSHCNYVVVLNPNRSRAREYCASCDQYICDGCGLKKKLGAMCIPMVKRIETIQEQAFKEVYCGEMVIL